MKEEETLALRGVTLRDLPVLCAEPVYLIGMHTVVAVLTKALAVACVKEPKSELDIGPILIIDREHIVECVRYVRSIWESEAEVEGPIQLAHLLPSEITLSVVIPCCRCPVDSCIHENLGEVSVLESHPGSCPVVPSVA